MFFSSSLSWKFICDSKTNGNETTTTTEYCLEGTTSSFSAECCSNVDEGASLHRPIFDDLLPRAKQVCDSDTSQYIANQEYSSFFLNHHYFFLSDLI